jgi:hypothetical protein
MSEDAAHHVSSGFSFLETLYRLAPSHNIFGKRLTQRDTQAALRRIMLGRNCVSHAQRQRQDPSRSRRHRESGTSTVIALIQ